MIPMLKQHLISKFVAAVYEPGNREYPYILRYKDQDGDEVALRLSTIEMLELAGVLNKWRELGCQPELPEEAEARDLIVNTMHMRGYHLAIHRTKHEAKLIPWRRDGRPLPEEPEIPISVLIAEEMLRCTAPWNPRIRRLREFKEFMNDGFIGWREIGMPGEDYRIFGLVA